VFAFFVIKPSIVMKFLFVDRNRSIAILMDENSIILEIGEWFISLERKESKRNQLELLNPK
tara:strand:+ start:316 stop:498 length:183 start_codon:yes stop_codon:yes gene_type:complete